jgi:hypothetical protein
MCLPDEGKLMKTSANSGATLRATLRASLRGSPPTSTSPPAFPRAVSRSAARAGPQPSPATSVSGRLYRSCVRAWLRYRLDACTRCLHTIAAQRENDFHAERMLHREISATRSRLQSL